MCKAIKRVLLMQRQDFCRYMLINLYPDFSGHDLTGPAKLSVNNMIYISIMRYRYIHQGKYCPVM